MGGLCVGGSVSVGEAVSCFHTRKKKWSFCTLSRLQCNDMFPVSSEMSLKSQRYNLLDLHTRAYAPRQTQSDSTTLQSKGSTTACLPVSARPETQWERLSDRPRCTHKHREASQSFSPHLQWCALVSGPVPGLHLKVLLLFKQTKLWPKTMQ